jgi:hypothetical protein
MRQSVLLACAIAMLTVAATAAAPQRPAAAGEEVIVTHAGSGEELRGRLLEFSQTTLAMLVHGRRVEVPLEQIVRIDGTRDSVKNGAIIGAVAMGGWCAVVCGQGLDDSGQLTAAVLLNSGFGALIGAGIDALHKGRTPIYVKPARSGGILQLTVKF